VRGVGYLLARAPNRASDEQPTAPQRLGAEGGEAGD